MRLLLDYFLCLFGRCGDIACPCSFHKENILSIPWRRLTILPHFRSKGRNVASTMCTALDPEIRNAVVFR